MELSVAVKDFSNCYLIKMLFPIVYEIKYLTNCLGSDKITVWLQLLNEIKHSSKG